MRECDDDGGAPGCTGHEGTAAGGSGKGVLRCWCEIKDASTGGKESRTLLRQLSQTAAGNYTLRPQKGPIKSDSV